MLLPFSGKCEGEGRRFLQKVSTCLQTTWCNIQESCGPSIHHQKNPKVHAQINAAYACDMVLKSRIQILGRNSGMVFTTKNMKIFTLSFSMPQEYSYPTFLLCSVLIQVNVTDNLH